MSNLAPASGRLGVLTPGLGAVTSTFVAGVMAARRGLQVPVGSLSQLGTMSVDGVEQPIQQAVPLAGLNDMVFGGWDPISPNLLEAARTAKVLEERDIAPISAELEGVVGMDAVFDQRWVSRLEGQRVKTVGNKYEQALALMDDIERFRIANQCDRLVSVWCGSTEAYQEASEVHQSIASFEAGLKANDDNISPSQIYAYALISSGVPYANGAPNLSFDVPALEQLAIERNVPISGKDFKTGQTYIKTVLARAIKTRLLGMHGWYSTNILGNRDGEVLDAPENFKTKEVSKLGVIEGILEPEDYPELYGDVDHVVRINYYRPKGDNKEGWDNIDIFGWMGYPMEIKVNFLCRDSILAAPIVLDLALFMDLAGRAGAGGVQDFLSFYFKSPCTPGGISQQHDVAVQQAMLKNQLRTWIGAETIPTVIGG